MDAHTLAHAVRKPEFLLQRKLLAIFVMHMRKTRARYTHTLLSHFLSVLFAGRILRLEYDRAGKLVKTDPAARPVGTTVSLTELFKTLPVMAAL